MRLKTLVLTIICGLGLLAANQAAATTYIVDDPTDDNATCEVGSCSLREAITAAETNPGQDTIRVIPGAYLLDSRLEINNQDVIIRGFRKNTTVLDAQDLDQVLYVAEGSTLTISKVTLVNGYSTGDGGAIYNQGDLTIFNANIRNSEAGSGGAIYNGTDGYLGSGANADIIRVTFRNNTATSAGGAIINDNGSVNIEDSRIYGSTSEGSGGAIFNNADFFTGPYTLDCDLTITDSLIQASQAENGGAIYNTGTAEIENTDIIYNTASTNGGGIYNTDVGLDANLSITTSDISLNTADNYGGGIYENGYNTTTISDSDFSENEADLGGALYNRQHDTDITNCNIADNIAVYGAGIYTYYGDVNVATTILLDNMRPAAYVPMSVNCYEDGGNINSLGGNTDSDGTCGF